MLIFSHFFYFSNLEALLKDLAVVLMVMVEVEVPVMVMVMLFLVAFRVVDLVLGI